MKYRLQLHCETGSEGMVWCYYECDKNWKPKRQKGYYSYKWQHELRKGRKIIILNEDGTIFWQGKTPYTRTNYEKFYEKELKRMSYSKWIKAFRDGMKVIIK